MRVGDGAVNQRIDLKNGFNHNHHMAIIDSHVLFIEKSKVACLFDGCKQNVKLELCDPDLC